MPTYIVLLIQQVYLGKFKSKGRFLGVIFEEPVKVL